LFQRIKILLESGYALIKFGDICSVFGTLLFKARLRFFYRFAEAVISFFDHRERSLKLRWLRQHRHLEDAVDLAGDVVVGRF
jgi:hypothetical protein